MERPTPSDMLPKRDQERDLELDKKIQALRRKNEVLMKRYKEVEEDRKRAEEEGMALQGSKGKADDLTITISKSTTSQDNRVVVTKPFNSGSPAEKGQQEAGNDRGGEGPPQGAGRGHRKQLMVTMAGKKGKRVVSERLEKRPGPVDIKSPTDDGQARRVESAGRGKQPPHSTKRDTAAQDDVRHGQKHTEDHQRLSEQCQESEGPQASTDLNVPTSKEEQEEYVQWKKEREQIDKDRVARHRNAKGQWRRAWDMDKTDNMFPDKSLPDRDRGPSSRGGRNAKKGQSRACASDSKGHEKRGKDKGAKNVQVMSSNAKGIDRLTGRARRWQANEEGENLETSDTALDDFLEELDALTDTESEDHKDQDSKLNLSPCPDSPSAPKEVSGSTAPVSPQGIAEAWSPSRGSEKKVRFSEELVQAVHTRQTAASLNSPVTSESRGLRFLKRSSPKKSQNKVKGPPQFLESAKQDYGTPLDQGGGPSAPPLARQQQAFENECTKKDSTLTPTPIPTAAPTTSPSPEKACASLQGSCIQPVELAKCNLSTTNTEELIASGLSVLSLESGETHPTHSTSSDKAREHGKIV